ncbi:MAG TPA: hypothetical protein VGI73_09230 [Solirubrobacterales bacterium]|jgi:hypothetical protein
MVDERSILEQLQALGNELRSRLDSIDRRLEALEQAGVPAPQLPEVGAGVANGHAQLDPAAPLRTVEVTIAPLHDVSRVRVVEAAFNAIDGVESTSLHTLTGDSAQLEVKAREGVSLIGGLRQTLRVAFDVSESDATSFTMELAHPGAEPQGGVAAPQP